MTTPVQPSDVFLEQSADLWLLTVGGEQIPFRSANSLYLALDMAYALLERRGLAGLVFQSRAADGRYYLLPNGQPG